MVLVFLATQAAIAYSPISLPKDTDGWTVFTPSADSRIIYVSNAGNDATGQFYSPGDPVLGANPFNPTGTINAFDTYSAARQQARDGYPDWILFKRGDTFSAQIEERSGRSDTEFALVSAYGSSGAMPVINPPTATTIPLELYTSTGFQRYAIMGLDFYHKTRDPDSPDYTGTSGSAGFQIFGSGGSGGIRQLLIEGCKFRFFSINVMQSYAGASVGEIVIRRNLILDNYSGTGGNSHGLYVGDETGAGALDGFLFEENILDHNGWYSKTGIGQPAMFNHNTYFSDVHNVTYKNNILTRAASLCTKIISSGTANTSNVTVEDNLIIDGEVGISAGGDTGNYRFTNMEIKDNVITNIDRDPPTERDIGWGLNIQAWDNGTLSGNLLLNWDNASITNTYAIEVTEVSRDVVIEDNIVYNFNPNGSSDYPDAFMMQVHSNFSGSNMTFRRNLLQDASNSAGLIYFEAAGDESSWTFEDNKYYSGVEGFIIGSTGYDFAGWVTQTGETGSFGTYSFPDPTRSIEGYMTHIGRQATIDAFIEACRNQGRYSWDSSLAAASVNSWLRAGYGVGDEPEPPPSSPQSPSGLRVVD